MNYLILIQLNYRDAKPIYEQIKEGLRKLVVSNALAAGDKLPSVRELTKKLGVSKNTVESAYQQLCAEGYVVSVPKSGFVVTKVQEVFYHAEKNLQQKIKESNLGTLSQNNWSMQNNMGDGITNEATSSGCEEWGYDL